jgi:hypothetical protein
MRARAELFPRMSPERLAVLLGLISTLLLFWLAIWRIPSALGPTLQNYYPQYGQALREGRLWLMEAKSVKECPFDMSFFEGKCYMYFGIFPAVIHALLPSVSERIVAILFGALGLFFLAKILWSIAERLSPRPIDPRDSLPLVLAALLTSHMGTTALIGRVYEEAMTVSCGLGFASIYCLLPLLCRDRPISPRQAALGGTLLGLAGLSRASWFMNAAALAAFVAYESAREKAWLSKRNVALFAPIAIAGLVQAGIDWARFHNPLEIGFRYSTMLLVLGPGDSEHGVMSLWNLPENIATYFFIGCFTFSRFHTWIQSALNPFLILSEFPIALFICMPILWLTFSPRTWAGRPTGRVLTGPVVVLLPMAIPPLLQWSQVNRYQTEIWAFVLCSAVPLLMVRAGQASRREKYAYWGSLVFGALMIGINSERLFQLLRNAL